MVFLLVLEFDKKNSRQIRSVITNKHEDIKDHVLKELTLNNQSL